MDKLGIYLYLSLFVMIASGRVVKKEATQSFVVHVNEDGSPFDESVVVDLVNDVEVFHVPAHNVVSETTFLIDYKTNSTVRHVTHLDRCYVSDLDAASRLSRPAELTVALKAAEGKSATRDIQLIEYSWKVDRPLTYAEMEGLSSATKELCRGSIVLRVRPTEHRTTAAVGEPADISHPRHKRGLTPAPEPEPEPEDGCPVANQRLRCTRVVAACRYVYVQTCDEAYQQSIRPYDIDCVDENTLHIFDKIICCTDCCDDRAKCTAAMPYCEDMTKDDIPPIC